MLVGDHADATFLVEFFLLDFHNRLDVRALALRHHLLRDVRDLAALVRRLQMLLEERLVAETSIAELALRDFQVNLVVSTERRLVAERHEAGDALVGLRRAVHQRVLLERRFVAEFLAAKFYKWK